MNARWLMLLITLFGFSLTASADEALEKRYLARLLQEITTLKQLSYSAEQYQQKHERSNERFRYDWLRDDLTKMETGIREKLHLPQIQPRQVMPLKGTYLAQEDTL